MKNAKIKRLVALTAATSMVLAPATVFAADTGSTESADGDTSAGSTITGDGTVEEFIDKDVFKVTLPTGDIDFTIDPQGLLGTAAPDKYTGGPGAVYFKNAADSGDTYSNKSDPITIGNKSSYDVDVSFSVDVTVPEGITMTASADELDDAEVPSLYLGLEVDTNAAVALTSGTNTATVKQLGKVPEKTDGTGYEIKAEAKADGSGYTYSYVLGDSFDPDTIEAVDYVLTGQCDATADWSSVKTETVGAEVIWSCTKHSDGPTITSGATAVTGQPYGYTANFTKGTPLALTLSLPNGVTVSSAGWCKLITDTPSTTNMTVADNTVTVGGANWSGAASGDKRFVIITLSDSSTLKIQITIA